MEQVFEKAGNFAQQYLPDILKFGLKVILCIAVYFIGKKVIDQIVRVLGAGQSTGRGHYLYGLYNEDHSVCGSDSGNRQSVRPSGVLCGRYRSFRRSCHRPGSAGRTLESGGRLPDPAVSALSGGRLHYHPG